MVSYQPDPDVPGNGPSDQNLGVINDMSTIWRKTLFSLSSDIASRAKISRPAFVSSQNQDPFFSSMKFTPSSVPEQPAVDRWMSPTCSSLRLRRVISAASVPRPMMNTKKYLKRTGPFHEDSRKLTLPNLRCLTRFKF